MTTLQKLSINFFFLPLFLFAYGINNNTKTHIKLDINAYSNQLYFDTFSNSNKWTKLPSNISMNKVLDFSSFSIYKNIKNYSIGYKFNSQGIFKINKGALETWYYSEHNFNILLKNSNVGTYVGESNIYQLLNYYEDNSFFYKQILINNNDNVLSITFNILKGKNFQHLKITGTNTKSRFKAKLDYYYSDKNILTKVYNPNKAYGYGSSIDMALKIKKKYFNLSIAIYNMFGFIQWHGLVHAIYNFDSNTKYIDSNGYIHYKAFGIGTYKYNQSYMQILPVFTKYSFSIDKNLYSYGINGLFISNINYNEIFYRYKWIKLGYIPQINNITYGFKYKFIGIDISNNIKTHSKFAKLYFNISY